MARGDRVKELVSELAAELVTQSVELGKITDLILLIRYGNEADALDFIEENKPFHLINYLEEVPAIWSSPERSKTALTAAVRANYLEVVKELLSQGADPARNVPTRSHSPFYSVNSPEMFFYLMDVMPELIAKHVSSESIFQHAIFNAGVGGRANLEKLVALLEPMGIDWVAALRPDQREYFDGIAEERERLIEATDSLMNNEMISPGVTSTDGENLLHNKNILRNPQFVRQICNENPGFTSTVIGTEALTEEAPIHTLDQLISNERGGKYNVLRALRDCGADLGLLNSFGQSLFHRAASDLSELDKSGVYEFSEEHKDILKTIEMLLDAGVDHNTKDELGETAYGYLSGSGNIPREFTEVISRMRPDSHGEVDKKSDWWPLW